MVVSWWGRSNRHLCVQLRFLGLDGITMLVEEARGLVDPKGSVSYG
jgi:hypothetical protein